MGRSGGREEEENTTLCMCESVTVKPISSYVFVTRVAVSIQSVADIPLFAVFQDYLG